MTGGDQHPRAVVCIGASWGGLDALREVLAPLPADLPAAVCIVQHRAEERGLERLVEMLDAATELHVCEPDDKEPIQAGHVYVAPAGYHLLVDGDQLSLSTEERVRWARPSVDVLFESAAATRTSEVVAVLLTGANDDGARGARSVREHGGVVLVQDPETAMRREMPDAAIGLAGADAVLPLAELAGELARRVAEVAA